jgi:hypothetical protein
LKKIYKGENMSNPFPGVHRTTPVSDVPVIELRDWRVFELPDGDRHFVGWNLTESSGRTSSKIIEYNKETKTGITRSGRCYKLIDDSGINLDAMYVWEAWKHINGIDDATDVSDEY